MTDDGMQIRFGDQHIVCPCGMSVEWIIERWKRCFELTRGQQTVIDLLFHGH